MKYRNFRRLGAGYKTTRVPDELMLKKASLYVIEFSQFVIGGIIVFWSLYGLLVEEGNNPILYGLLLVIGVFLVISGCFLALDNPRYRTTAVTSMGLLLLAVILLVKKISVLLVVALLMLLALYFLYIHPPNKAYYSWVKSL